MDEELTNSSGVGKKFTVNVASPSQCKRVLSIEIPEEELKKEKEQITDNLRREIKVPGFRKGKVPLQYIKKNYGDMVRSEAVQNLLPRIFEEAVIAEGLHPLAEPKFENLKVEDGEGISVDATIEVRPEVQIEGYKRVSVVMERREVDEAQVDETLERLRERMSTFQTVDRPAARDDFIIIDYAPLLESGEPDEKARRENHPVDLTAEGLLPEFREGLTGLKAGDEKQLHVKYPDEFPDKDLEGAEKTFTVKMMEVKEKLLPELDDAFAKQVGGEETETLEALRSRIFEDLKKEADDRYTHEVSEKIIDKIIEANKFEVPEAMVENYFRSIIEEDRRRRPEVADENEREKEIRELFKDAAVRTIRKYIILDAVGKQEKITATDEEIDQKMESLAEKAGKTVDEVKKMFREPERRSSLEGEILDRKILDFLRESADIKVA